MKYKIGYITALRKAFFWSVLFAIVIFGSISTVASSLIGIVAISNIISAIAFFVGVFVCLLVYADRNDHFTDYGLAAFEEDGFKYSDKKRHFSVKYSDIKRIDLQEIIIRQNSSAYAYKILIQTDRRMFCIESDRAEGRPYTEMEIYQLYLELQKRIARGEQ